jgi:hypothetical protein
MSDNHFRILLVEERVDLAVRYLSELKKAGFNNVHHVGYGVFFDATFTEFNDWELVVMDSCLDGCKTNTDVFVYRVRKLFGDQVRIIANSDSLEYTQQLMDAGCDTRSTGGKFQSFGLARVVKSLFYRKYDLKKEYDRYVW